MTGDLAAAAIAYARRGWRVIPLHRVRTPGDQAECGCFRRTDCGTPGKHPTFKNWRAVASADPVLVAQWWRAWPLSNVGIATGGVARLVAIDIDGGDGRDSLAKIEETHGPMPETLTQTTGRTGGGEHRLFTIPGDLDIDRIRNRVKIAPGIDIRAEGGLIVVPPSMHPTGAYYAWRDPNVPLAEMPSWLIKLATSQKARQVVTENAERPTEKELEDDGFPLARRLVMAREKLLLAEPAIQGQNGSGSCLKAACLLIRGYCLPTEHAFDLLWSVYNPLCVPAWSENELMHKIESAEYSVSDASYKWRFMIPPPDMSPLGRAVEALFQQANDELAEASRMANATPETNPEPTAGYINKPRRGKRNTEGNGNAA